MSPSPRKALQSAAKSLSVNKLHASLSALGIVFAVIAVVMMLAIAEGAKQELLDQIATLGTNTLIVRQLELTEQQHQTARINYVEGLSRHDVRILQESISDIVALAPIRRLRATVKTTLESQPPQILSTEAAYATIKRPSMRSGRFLCEEDARRRLRVCVLGSRVADQLLGNAATRGAVTIGGHPFRVVGVLGKANVKGNTLKALTLINHDNAIFIPSGTEGELLTEGELWDAYSELHIQLHPDTNARQYGAVIDRVLRYAHRGFKDFEVIIPEALIDQEQEAQHTFNAVLGCIALISLLVGGIGIMNIMLATVSERTREVGIKRAVGASQADIAAEFLAESCLLTFSGAVAGLIFGATGAGLVAYYAGWPIRITVWSMGASVTMAVLVGIFFGIYPAWKAAKLDPIAALRTE